MLKLLWTASDSLSYTPAVTSPNMIEKPVSPRAARPKKTPMGVLVLGMHRSGTSALTRVLNLLGCALPQALVGPSEGNELGHWESASAVILNDEILASAGSSWNDWGPINSDWRSSGMREQMVERATEVIREHKSLGPLFALKDPRLCRLADLWLEAADGAGVDIRVLLMLRHPGEVSASLESRDLMAPGYGQLLWLRHTLDAEHLSRGRKRVVCRFDRLLLDWQDTVDRIREGLDLALPRNSPSAHAEVDRFLARGMRHHDANEDTCLGLLGGFDWLRRTFEIMRRWSDKGEDVADHAELDRIRTEFDNAYPAFSRMLLPSGYSGEFATGSRLRGQLQLQLTEVSERAQAIEQQATEIDQLRARANELESKIAALTAAYETVQARSEELQNEAAALREAAARAAELDSVVEALRQSEGERDEAVAALEALEAEVESLRAAAAHVSGLEVEIARLAARETELAAWIDAQDKKLAAAGEANESEQKLRAEAEQKLAGREAELGQEKLNNAELTGRIQAAESAAVQRQEELAQLWTQLGTVQQAAGAASAESAAERERRVDAEARLAAAMEDLRTLGSEKGEIEIRVRIAELALASQRDEQVRAAEQLLEAKAATEAAAIEGERERKLRIEREGQLAEAQSQLADLRARLESLQQAPAPVPNAVFDELAQLTRLLQASETEAAAAAAARAAAERRIAEQTEELVRLSALLAQENGRAESSAGHAEWLREMARVAEAMPKWWSMMPEGWRRKREHDAYRRAGLFDAQLYLQNHPDVVADGMDPVRHYILHGMAEGRRM